MSERMPAGRASASQPLGDRVGAQPSDALTHRRACPRPRLAGSGLAPSRRRRRRSRPTDVRDEPLGLDLAATIGMIAYAITVAIGFSRVFVGWDFLGDLVAHRRHRPRCLLPDAPAPRSRRFVAIPAGARRAHLAGGVDLLPRHVHRRVPARRHVGGRARRLPAGPRRLPVDDAAGRLRRRVGVPRRSDDGGDRVARRHVRLPGPGPRRGARPRRRAVRVRRRPRRRRAADRQQPGGDRRRLLRPRPVAPAPRASTAHRARQVAPPTGDHGSGHRLRRRRRARRRLGARSQPSRRRRRAAVRHAQRSGRGHRDRVPARRHPLAARQPGGERAVHRARRPPVVLAGRCPARVRRRAMVAAGHDPRRRQRVGQRSRCRVRPQRAARHDPRPRRRPRSGSRRARARRGTRARLQLVDPDARQDDVGARRR